MVHVLCARQTLIPRLTFMLEGSVLIRANGLAEADVDNTMLTCDWHKLPLIEDRSNELQSHKFKPIVEDFTQLSIYFVESEYLNLTFERYFEVSATDSALKNRWTVKGLKNLCAAFENKF